MAFSSTASVTANTTSTASPSITVSPTSGVINATTMTPGQTVVGTVNVSNNGDVDVYYFLTADWAAGGTTAGTMARILADNLAVSVTVSPATSLYAGTLSGLINQPASPGQSLPSPNIDTVFISVTLPSDAGYILQNLDLTTDFVFVATT